MGFDVPPSQSFWRFLIPDTITVSRPNIPNNMLSERLSAK